MCGDCEEQQPLTTGRADAASGDQKSEHPAAVLWLPDPEQRHGWREFYVYRKDDKPGRPIGFRQ